MGTEGRYSDRYEGCLWGFGDGCVILLALGKEGHYLVGEVCYEAKFISPSTFYSFLHGSRCKCLFACHRFVLRTTSSFPAILCQRETPQASRVQNPNPAIESAYRQYTLLTKVRSSGQERKQRKHSRSTNRYSRE